MDNGVMYYDHMLGERSQFVVDFICNKGLKKLVGI